MRQVYLRQIPRFRALALLLEHAALPRREEMCPTRQALHRVTARPVFACRSLPGYHASAMDGIAVRAARTFAASDQNPLHLNQGEDYWPVDTGDPLPAESDAVIKIEDVQPRTELSVEIIAPAVPWQHVRPVGEDIVAREILLPASHRLGPADLAALLAGGVTDVPVLARPRVAIIPTGDEIVPAGQEVRRGEIPEFNSAAIAGYLSEWGALPEVLPIVRDSLEELKAALADAISRFDLAIVIAGSSLGREDYTSRAVAALGELLVHGVATRPGKPVILGVKDGKPLIGLPGYPVSAYLALEWFVRPVIFRHLGLPEPERPKIKAYLGRRVVSEMGSEEFVRLSVGLVGARYVANPLSRGAGVTMSLVRADALLVVPANSLGYEQGAEVEIELYRTERELRHTLLAAGSHDLALDLLGTALRRADCELTLSSAHLGSMGGIAAIKNGQAHLAGVHLFDSATGEYNIPFVRRFLAGEHVVLVNLAYRMQGWIVAQGNPKGIKELEDLAREEVSFVNRQRGAGTRLLLDHLLTQTGLAPERIYGYGREEYTHLNVAAAVAAGTADAGLGIYPAARVYHLDFLPVAEERYDLLMTQEFYESDRGRILLDVIASADFKAEVEAMGGYSLREAGQLMYEQ